MFSEYKLLNFYCVLILIFSYLNCPISAIDCYECNSTFLVNSVCLPECSHSYQMNSTCLLTRNIPFETTGTGSLHAKHISGESPFATATEKNFVFGEEAAYLESVGWSWEYGSITYGCDTSGCNNPQNINRLPKALNARISNATLDQYLAGNAKNSCYQCDTCFDENNSTVDMFSCAVSACPNYACNLVATRNSPSSIVKCGTNWHFSSNCIPSHESAQVDMTLMYYLQSKTIVLYQMQAICLTDNCNNFTTFQRLKNAITVDPDLSCLVNDTFSSTTSSSSSSTTTTTTTTSTTSAGYSMKSFGKIDVFIYIIFIMYSTIKHQRFL